MAHQQWQEMTQKNMKYKNIQVHMSVALTAS